MSFSNKLQILIGKLDQHVIRKFLHNFKKLNYIKSVTKSTTFGLIKSAKEVNCK